MSFNKVNRNNQFHTFLISHDKDPNIALFVKYVKIVVCYLQLRDEKSRKVSLKLSLKSLVHESNYYYYYYIIITVSSLYVTGHLSGPFNFSANQRLIAFLSYIITCIKPDLSTTFL